MKLAIITLYDEINFGNRLQNYAVQTYFERLGFDVYTISYEEQTYMPMTPIRLIKYAVHCALFFTKYEKNRKKHLLKITQRRNYISEFSRQYLKVTPKIRYCKLPQNFSREYDYFVTGSDQVWHGWKDCKEELEYFFLTFADYSQRLTIIPSFGFDEFPQKYIEIYKKGLEGFEYLSVREERGAELIRELTGKDATVLLDPTMLIDISEWLKVLKKPSQYVDDNYIFVYSLGGFKGEIREKTCKLAGEFNLQVIDIMDINSDYYTHTRPDEFLYWIHNAKLVVTDSFHASIFSLLFNRPFIVTERNDIVGMNNRFDTLFKKFGIKNRTSEVLKTGFDKKEEREKIFTVDYSCVPWVLKAERDKAKEFYKKCFHLDL